MTNRRYIDNKEKDSGFSLVELIVVIAVMAVLVGVLAPAYLLYVERSREAKDLGNVHSVYGELYAALQAEDQDVEYNGIKMYQNGVYKASVELTQGAEDWQRSTPITLADVTWNGENNNDRWTGTPGPGGRCDITVDMDGKAYFAWSGGTAAPMISGVMDSAYDYFAVLAAGMKTSGTGSWCVNSTCDKNSTISSITGKITDEVFNGDIVTWAVVRDTRKSGSNNNGTNSSNSYLMSTFDITGLAAGTEVPAVYCLDNGKYYVGTAKVSVARDKNGGKNYNILTEDRNGNYAYNYTYDEAQKKTVSSVNTEYEYDNLLADSKEYESREEAQAAYRKLVTEYLAEHPDAKEGRNAAA